MKRLCVFAVIFVCLITIFMFSNSTLAENFDCGVINYYAYVNNLTNVDFAKYNVVVNGKGAIIKTSHKNAKQVLLEGYDIAGECVELDKNYGLNNIINKLNLKIESEELINGLKVYVGYSNKLPSYILSNNNKINIQIATTKNSVLVGYPLILHSF